MEESLKKRHSRVKKLLIERTITTKGALQEENSPRRGRMLLLSQLLWQRRQLESRGHIEISWKSRDSKMR